MRIIFIVIAFLKIGICSGQKHFTYQLGIDYGSILGAESYEGRNVSSVFLDISKLTNGEKYWQADHKYPQMGITLNSRNLHNYKSLSHVFSVVPYLEFNLLANKFGVLQVKHGTGLAWFTGEFNSVYEQPIGSRLNAASFIDLGFELNFGKHLKFKPGVSLYHQSNGNVLLPNNGLNTATVYLQGRFISNTKPIERQAKDTKINLKNWTHEVRLTSGLSQYNKELKALKMNFQLLGMIGFQHSTRFRTSGGLEMLFLQRNIEPVSSFYMEENVLIGHLITKYGLGVYLNKEGLNGSILYEKVGIAYFPFKLNKHVGRGLNIGTAIKAHGFKAQNIDFSVGYLL